MSTQETILNGRYRLISQQGSGGMAVVYKAEDLALGRIVAVKVLRPSLTSDPSFLTRFRQEARNVANLAHPNIVTLHDFGQDGNTYYMVMEFVEGKDLKKLIRESAPFSVERTLHIGIQICAGIGYAHRAGLVHADVKPQNILITGNDQVKVTDFGIAQALSASQNQERQSIVWGSPHYFAPEQASGEPPNTTSDVYSIGIVLFEMLTGKLPYNGADQQELALAHIREAVPHVQSVNPNVPLHLDRIIYKVMQKEPSARYRMADQLGRILAEYRNQGGEGTSSVAQQSPAPVPVPIGNQVPAQPSPQPIGQQPPTVRPVAIAGNAPSQSPPVMQPRPTAQSVQPQPIQSQPVSIQPSNPTPTRNPVMQPKPYAPAAPPTGNTGPLRNSATAAANRPGPYIPPGRPTGQTGPQYSVPSSRSGGIDLTSVLLGIIAFIAVVGLIILWLAVFNAYR